MADYIPDGFSQSQGFNGLQFGNNRSGFPAVKPPVINTNNLTMGGSVLGIKYTNGVLVAADTLVTYGSLARYQDIERVFKINNTTVLGGTGDFADIQGLRRSIDLKIMDDICRADDCSMLPSALSSWITRVLYSRRTRLRPLQVDIVVGGFEACKPFLSLIDMRGCCHQSYAVCTGMGRQLAMPLIQERKPEGREFNFSEACWLIRDCMKTLYYRDTRSIPQYTVCICTSKDCSIKGPFKVEEMWDFAESVHGY